MSAPRLVIDLSKIYHNAHTLVARLERRGITVVGVTKAVLGSLAIANTFLQAGVSALCDSRVENIESMRRAGLTAPMMLIRSPMLSQVDRIIKELDLSFNTELAVLRVLSNAARKQGKIHDIVLMVELGDLREGILPEDLENIVRHTLALPNLALKGIGTNLACLSGVIPSAKKMTELSALADSIENTFDLTLDIVSGGNSGNLSWAFNGAGTGRVNHLRLGESILLGRETLHRSAIDGLHTDAITLVAEVIESKLKPSKPWGEIAQTAFGEKAPAMEQGSIRQALFAVGQQDTDHAGLLPPSGITILGASSDHLVVNTGSRTLAVGTEMTFQLNYSALVRCMTSPFVVKVIQEHGHESFDSPSSH